MKNRHYYVSGHTRIGYFSVLPEIVKKLDCLFIIKGLSKNKSNSLIKMLGNMFQEQGVVIDFLHSPSNNNHLEGIVIPKYKFAVIDSEPAKTLDEKMDEHRSIYLNLKNVYNDELLNSCQEIMIQLEKERQFHINSAYQIFAEAKQYHQRKEDIYIKWMDFKKADAVCDKLKKTIFTDTKVKSGVQGNVEEIFFGAATPKGAVHFIEELTEGLEQRFIIKGRSGSGKSTLMRRIGSHAINQGLDVTYFLCGFDPSSVDMIIIPELKVAIIDGTAPHVINPTREKDQIIDMFELCINPVVEDKQMDEINKCETNYKAKMEQGTHHLLKASEVQNVLDEYLDSTIDNEKIESLEKQAVERIIQVLN